jgi:hypothetical protein
MRPRRQLHFGANLCCGANTENSFVKILIRALSASVGVRVMVSDIVKRRSIRALGAAVKLRAARYLQAFP